MSVLVFACVLSGLLLSVVHGDLRRRAQKGMQLLFHRHHLHHLLASHQRVTGVSFVVARAQTPSAHADTEIYRELDLTPHTCNSTTKE